MSTWWTPIQFVEGVYAAAQIEKSLHHTIMLHPCACPPEFCDAKCSLRDTLSWNSRLLIYIVNTCITLRYVLPWNSRQLSELRDVLHWIPQRFLLIESCFSEHWWSKCSRFKALLPRWHKCSDCCNSEHFWALLTPCRSAMNLNTHVKTRVCHT